MKDSKKVKPNKLRKALMIALTNSINELIQDVKNEEKKYLEVEVSR